MGLKSKEHFGTYTPQPSLNDGSVPDILCGDMLFCNGEFIVYEVKDGKVFGSFVDGRNDACIQEFPCAELVRIMPSCDYKK